MGGDTALYNIYAVRNKVTGRIYIGCTHDVETRIKQHFMKLRRGEKTARTRSTRTRSIWQQDYDSFGESSFGIYLIQSGVSEIERTDVEQYWIEKYNSDNPRYGYN